VEESGEELIVALYSLKPDGDNKDLVLHCCPTAEMARKGDDDAPIHKSFQRWDVFNILDGLIHIGTQNPLVLTLETHIEPVFFT
jgi:hypothetical protein